MKVLTAGIGTSHDDFSHALPGEITFLGIVCGRDDPDSGGDGGCGCGRAFTGLTSRKGTTVAVVTELDISLDELAVMARDSQRTAGYDVDDEDGRDLAEEIAEIAGYWEVGTRLKRIRQTDEVAPE